MRTMCLCICPSKSLEGTLENAHRKKFKCYQCDFASIHDFSLRVHQCDSAFVRKSHMRTGMKMHYSPENPLTKHETIQQCDYFRSLKRGCISIMNFTLLQDGWKFGPKHLVMDVAFAIRSECLQTDKGLCHPGGGKC